MQVMLEYTRAPPLNSLDSHWLSCDCRTLPWAPKGCKNGPIGSFSERLWLWALDRHHSPGWSLETQQQWVTSYICKNDCFRKRGTQQKKRNKRAKKTVAKKKDAYLKQKEQTRLNGYRKWQFPKRRNTTKESAIKGRTKLLLRKKNTIKESEVKGQENKQKENKKTKVRKGAHIQWRWLVDNTIISWK